MLSMVVRKIMWVSLRVTRDASGKGINAVYRTLALVGVALVAAIASFQDTLALAMGKAGLIIAVAALMCVLVGAALSFALKSSRRHMMYAPAVAHEDPDTETHTAT